MSEHNDQPGGKGRPTPSRREAEAARKAQMKKANTRKDQMKAQRAMRDSAREKQRRALAGEGSAADLPSRDRGPVKAFVRDYVDRRFSVAEFLLPLLVLMLVLSTVGGEWGSVVVVYLWMATILLVGLDSVRLVVGVRRQIRTRFGAEHVRGTTSYALLRSTQLRRFRLPKAMVPRGAPLKERY
ncbi:DUF3043 domain-containing protein [Aeromicrobium sp. IC_218]|uniref:DUF3043 domain-containing protein n=1 Tax=Aeromicrobium sp. IC_218 TaxID=2545468 RepID=UPI001A954FD1|nr:DUF3043 domain-containing protein [Aeromicrobium sp. IC_218]